MKKVILLTAAAFVITAGTFADNGKARHKGKCTRSSCSKSGKTCGKEKSAAKI